MVGVNVGVTVGSQGTKMVCSARVRLGPPLAWEPTAHRLVDQTGSLATARRALDVEPGLSEKICVHAEPSQCNASVRALLPVSS